MNNKHSFSFEGGDILSKMSATWFVSYMYYLKIDKNHINWKKYESRIYYFNKSMLYHKFWLQKILEMNEKNLQKNKIGVAPDKVKEMAQILLKVVYY